MNRRDCLKSIGAAGAAVTLPSNTATAKEGKFSINYVLASALYGDMKLSQILPEVEHSGAIGLDIWGKPHGTQREELDEIGVDAFTQMLKDHKTELIASTRYPLGPFGLQQEMPVLEQLGGKYLVCGSPNGPGPKGENAKKAVLQFIEAMKPHADAAEEHGLTIAIENHSKQLISHPDSIRYFAEFNRHKALGIALAPHHLREHTKLLPELILELGNENLPFMYFQEYGDGAYHKLQKQLELEQLPGRGELDYSMIVRALKHIEFSGVAEIFMHPTPRGGPILEKAESITELFNESRIYVDNCLAEIS
jgi:sugar phosphate isomerase/epimerase